MPNPPLEFSKVEALRKHMILTMANMAKLFGVTRVTYAGWVKGKPVRTKNDAKVRGVLRQLLHAMSEGWPQPDVIAMEQKKRFETLLEVLKPEE